jgi:hypothetical protein
MPLHDRDVRAFVRGILLATVLSLLVWLALAWLIL